jgi:mono/diheme cytochrome c family protein
MKMSSAAIRSTMRFTFIMAFVAATVGCGKTPPASFRLNMVQATKTAAPESGMEKPWSSWANDRQKQVATILEAMYGTPDAPVALAETGLDLAKLQLAAGPVRSDIVGRKNGLYREHCAHCHGISGDGMGPTAAFLNPYPRDYRPGKYKFKSTWRDARPARDDLTRVLHDGVPGSSMPSFALLPPEKFDALVEYVRYLSMRGETELALYTYAEQELGIDDTMPTTKDFLVDEILTPIVEKWQGAEEARIPIAAVPANLDFTKPGDDLANQESVARGRALFHGDGGCVKCHGAEKRKGGLRLDAKRFALKGGETGPTALVPGDADKSLVYTMSAHAPDHEDVMPSKGKLLSLSEIETIKRWIDQGGAWPD